VNTIGDLYTISASLPPFTLPNFKSVDIIALIPNAFTIAILAAIESLLSCVVSDKMIDDKHNSNTELIAQGAGNMCSALFGGIPATGAIARTAANVKNGGRSPISGIVHALVLLLVLVLFMPYAAWIPMPVIAAVLFIVAYNMSEWRHFVAICKRKRIFDTLVLVITFVFTVVFDLVVAIAVGLAVHYLIFFIKKIIEKKKATYYGIGMALNRLIKAILNDENSILTVSTYQNNEYGQQGMYIGVPAIINKDGVKDILKLKLNKDDQKLFNNSCEIMKENIKNAIEPVLIGE
jgi:MFS superfamily sulfate permease-like transporter